MASSDQSTCPSCDGRGCYECAVVHPPADSRLTPIFIVSEISNSNDATLTITLLPLYGEGKTWFRREPSGRLAPVEEGSDAR